MSILVLLALLAGALALQYRLDLGAVRQLASERRWSAPRLGWTPRTLWNRRWRRTYWLHYRDESGRPTRRKCHLDGISGGNGAVELESIPTQYRTAARPREHTPIARAGRLALAAFIGLHLGLAAGVGGSFLLFPGSNVAPAYGVLWMGPLGLAAGVLYGTVRGRRQAPARSAACD